VTARYGAPAPDYELYDLTEDPWELNNVAGDPAYAGVERELRKRLEAHLAGIDDNIMTGFAPNKEGHPDVPLWERRSDGQYRLRDYRRDEGSDVPFGEQPRQHD
jgi:hypothetical protein